LFISNDSYFLKSFVQFHSHTLWTAAVQSENKASVISSDHEWSLTR